MLSNDKSSGFTLVELMVALVIAAFAMVGIYRGYVSMVVANETQEDVIELTQSVRIALKTMADDIRTAGYNPRDVTPLPGAPVTFTVADVSDITFRGDFSDSGNAVALETLNYQLNGDELQWTHTTPTAVTTGTIMDNVEVLDLVYLNSVGTVLPTPVANRDLIRSVQIAIVARSTNADPTYNHNETYVNLQGTALVGPAAYPANDMFHRRSLTMEVKCRNNT